jgi:hypothetical protein
MKILQKEITGTQTSFPSNIINTWSQNQMSWYENLLKRWTQIDCPRRAIKSFQFVHFASNCALSVPLCVLPPSLSLSLFTPRSRTNSVFPRCKLGSLSGLVSSVGAGAASGRVAFELPSSKHGAHSVAHWAPCSAQLMASGRLASMPMRSCLHSCPTTLQRVFFCKDMVSLVAFASLRWDLVWPTSTDCNATISHQSYVLAAYNFGLP